MEGDCELYPNTNFIWRADKLPQPAEQRELMGAEKKSAWTEGVTWLWLERSQVQRCVLMLTETHFRDWAIWLQGCELHTGLLSQFFSIRSIDFVSHTSLNSCHVCTDSQDAVFSNQKSNVDPQSVSLYCANHHLQARVMSRFCILDKIFNC